MIEVERLTKRYGPVTAIRDVSFSVAPGQIVGFLGPNGAGSKTNRLQELQQQKKKRRIAELLAVKTIKSAEIPVSPKLLPVNIPKDDLKNGMQNYHERKYAEAISAHEGTPVLSRKVNSGRPPC